MKYKLLILSLIFLISCGKEIEINNKSEYVIEAWIDVDYCPVVIVGKTLAVSSEPQSRSDITLFVETYAKVSMWDDKDTVIFFGKVDKNYPLSYIYTTGRIKGKVGKTYHLKVEVGDFVATAQTTIPATIPILDSLSVFEISNERKGINALVSRQLPNKYFAFFEKRYNQDGYYLKTFWGLFTDDEISDEPTNFEVFKGKQLLTESFEAYFDKTDSVYVKFSAMDSISYNFWDSFVKMTNLSRNPLFPYQENLKGNINGALGYFCGFASSYYLVY